MGSTRTRGRIIRYPGHSEDENCFLKRLNGLASDVVLVLSWNKGFKTSLSILEDDDHIKILITSNHLLSAAESRHTCRFYAVIGYDTGAEDNAEAMQKKLELYGGTGTTVVIPEAYDVVMWVAGFFDEGKCSITSNEEATIYTTATLCRDLNVKGMSLEQARNFLDKSLMTKLVGDAGIPVPRTVSIGPMADEHWKQLEERVVPFLRFPIIVKPKCSAGSFAVKRLTDVDEFQRWFMEAQINFPFLSFILQEFLVGPLISPSFVVTNQELKMLTVMDYPSSYFQMIQEGAPAIGIVVDEASLDFDLTGIVKKMIRAFSPMPDGCYHAEGLLVPDRGWTFIELGARAEGAIASKIAEMATGIDFEGIQILGAPEFLTNTLEKKRICHSRPQDGSSPHFAYMYYPQRAGRVIHRNDPRDIDATTSRVSEISWSVDVGDNLVASETLAQTVCQIVLQNDSGESLRKDVLYLKEHYLPVEID